MCYYANLLTTLFTVSSKLNSLQTINPIPHDNRTARQRNSKFGVMTWFAARNAMVYLLNVKI